LKTVFTIGNTEEGCDTILLEIGEGYCCYAQLKGAERTFESIKYITFDPFEAEARLLDILSDVKTDNCDKLVVCSSFPQSLLTPRDGHKNDYILLSVLYDSPSQKYLKDEIPEWQINVTYSVPLSFFNSVKDKFRFPQFMHAYTPSLKVFNGFSAPSQIDVYFGIRHFRVLVKKDNHIQLAQTYSYKNPLDVVYYLLKICYEVGLEQTEISVVLSGLIDENSAMFSELHSYFMNLHFAEAPAYSVPENDFPGHYFTSLYNLAACVS
jgi:hypothetical protein